MSVFDFMNKERESERPETDSQPPLPGEAAKQAVTPFYLEVCGKYSAYGYMFAEGYIKYGQLRVGDNVSVYDKYGKLKFERIKVTAVLDTRGIQADSIKGEGRTYAAVSLQDVLNLGDYEKQDIITTEILTFEKPRQDEAPKKVKVLPQARTYNDPDRRTHINMATNDIASMCASGSLSANREWVRDVGQDLYDAHGFDAMQEVFINVKTRYPAAQSQLSSIWDGVGGWAD